MNVLESKLLYFQYQEIKEHLRIIGSLIKSCSIGLADAAKLVVLLSKIDSRDFKSSGKNERSIYMVSLLIQYTPPFNVKA
jgi:hypothetical protein